MILLCVPAPGGLKIKCIPGGNETMKTREQLLKTLESLKDGKEYSITLEVIESSYKDELKKKNNEAKNLRARLLEAEKISSMVVEKYKELVSRLEIDANVDLALQKKLERLEAKCKRQEIEFTTEILKERRKKQDELKMMRLISTLNEAKSAYMNALLHLIVNTNQVEHDEKGKYEY
jgi:hypothetical protein